MFENEERHESYGLLSFSRASSGAAVPLFGSSIKHRNTIILRISNASLSRELNTDHALAKDMILEAELSQSQFAEAITSLNFGQGVPITLRYTKEKGYIEPCPYKDKRQEFEEDFATCQAESKQYYDEFSSYLTKLLEEKKSIGKNDREEIIKQLSVLKGKLFDNQEFVYRQFNEQMDKTVREAKGEIEAFVQNKMNEIATSSLADKDLLSKNPIEIA